MLFNSWTFVAFLALVLPLYYVLSQRWQNRFLLMASYVFYGFWDYRFCSLLAISTIVDYVSARYMERTDSRRRRRLYLAISVCVNLTMLGFFKYFNFFVGSAADLIETFGFEAHVPTLNIILPVGISFYTFQTIGYTADVYRRKQAACRHFWDYALYVAYFPQLVAGPIERAARLLPQLEKPRRVTAEDLATGVRLMLMGYIKKVVIADGFAQYCQATFGEPGAYTAVGLWLGVYCFAFQVYCDFAGYSDIARGVSRLMGIDLMENFRQPFLAPNITALWQRWHVSLWTWLRDYVYIPLGGNRKGLSRQLVNILATWLLCGLWHGANWTFVAWGALNGVLLVVHRLMRRDGRPIIDYVPATLGQWVRYVPAALFTFHLFCLGAVSFRATSLANASEYYAGMFGFLPGGRSALTASATEGILAALIFYGALSLVMDFACWVRKREAPVASRTTWWVRGLAYSVGILVLALVRQRYGDAFIYFQF
jgi:D-alanyl-lipoteichoic acid acyltransferase DltB (MBOAT superfamily)